MSQGGSLAGIADFVSNAVHPHRSAARPPVPFVGPVGTLGDSYTDEYQFYGPDRSQARNWVEILHQTRGVSFGQFSTKSRGEPRDQGFANNWARSDATSSDMIANQLPGLASQVALGKVQYAWVFIGGNDYLHLLENAQSGKIAPAAVPGAVVSTTAKLEANFLTAVGTLLKANPNVKLVVSTLPDVSASPAAQAAAASNPLAAALLKGVGEAIASYNGLIATVAKSSNRIALVDLAAATRQTATSGSGSLSFGGESIDVRTPGDDYHHFFLADSLHVGTVGQGIIAELFALSIDQKFGAQLSPPSQQEIVRLAAQVQRQAGHGGHTRV